VHSTAAREACISARFGIRTLASKVCRFRSSVSLALSAPRRCTASAGRAAGSWSTRERERDTATPLGYGVPARDRRGRRVLVGNAALLTDAGIDVTALTEEVGQAAAAGQTPMFAAVDAEAAVLIVVADPVKPDSADAVVQLKALGLEVWMLTGDNAATDGQTFAHEHADVRDGSRHPVFALPGWPVPRLLHDRRRTAGNPDRPRRPPHVALTC
jgi:hypothetical protein